MMVREERVTRAEAISVYQTIIREKRQSQQCRSNQCAYARLRVNVPVSLSVVGIIVVFVGAAVVSKGGKMLVRFWLNS